MSFCLRGCRDLPGCRAGFAVAVPVLNKGGGCRGGTDAAPPGSMDAAGICPHTSTRTNWTGALASTLFRRSRFLETPQPGGRDRRRAETEATGAYVRSQNPRESAGRRGGSRWQRDRDCGELELIRVAGDSEKGAPGRWTALVSE